LELSGTTWPHLLHLEPGGAELRLSISIASSEVVLSIPTAPSSAIDWVFFSLDVELRSVVAIALSSLLEESADLPVVDKLLLADFGIGEVDLMRVTLRLEDDSLIADFSLTLRLDSFSGALFPLFVANFSLFLVVFCWFRPLSWLTLSLLEFACSGS